MSSRSFYQNQAQAYFEQTFGVDPSSFLLPLIRHLSPGARILDVGCGAGRDMLWLTNRGYSCTGLDSSPALAELARRHTGLPVFEADFEAFDFQGMDMDALLLVGALVHVPHERFQLILSRILRALKPQGHVLLTMKQGQGVQTRPDGRVFYLWPKADLMPIFEDGGLRCLEYFEQQSKIRASDAWMSFVLQSQFCLRQI
ncbi:MAG: methyltransferase domain-containing protein [Desulfovermiculus sp.]|nr:methyltransferase domain-containing protein [Desulfovermiculus sp.]